MQLLAKQRLKSERVILSKQGEPHAFTPNEVTVAAMQDCRAGKTVKADTIESLFQDLNDDEDD